MQRLTKSAYLDNYLGGNLMSRFGFNGKEKDDETYGDGNEYDFDSRIYSPRLGKWFSVDPLQKKYPDVTPYNFAINSPILFMDFDGKDIIIGTKDPVYRAQVLGNLQKITNDKLIMDKHGKVSIEAQCNQNPEKDLKNGSQLLRDLIGDTKHEVNIQIPLNPEDGNETKALDAKGASNPEVGSDSYIIFNPDAKGENIVNNDGSNGRPAQVGLAHELIHGKKNAQGKNDQTPRPDLVDPDGGYNKPGQDIMPQVELDTRKEENPIREEQETNQRAIPESKDEVK